MDKELISLEEFKNISLLGDNLDEKLLGKCVRELQQLELKELIGNDTYNTLQEQIKSNTLTPENTILIEKMKYYLIYGTLSYYIHAIHYKLTNKGIQIMNDGSASAAGVEVVQGLISNYKSKFNQATKNLVAYINSDSDPNNDIDNVNTTSSSGLWLGNDNRDYDYWERYKRRAAKY